MQLDFFPYYLLLQQQSPIQNLLLGVRECSLFIGEVFSGEVSSVHATAV